MKKILLFFVLILLFAFLNAQTKSDSLLTALSEAEHDTTRVNIYTELSKQSMFSLPDTALKYLDKAEKICTENNYGLRTAYVLKLKGSAYWAKSQYKKAEKLYREAADFYLRNNGEKHLAGIYYNIALQYKDQKQKTKAFDALDTAETIALKHGDSALFINSLHLKAGMFHVSGNSDTAAVLLYRVLDFADKKNNIELQYKAATSLGSIFYKIGQDSLSLKEYRKALRIAKKMGDPYFAHLVSANMGLVYAELGDFKKSEELFLKVIKATDVNNNPDMIIRNLSNLSEVYILQKKTAKAENALGQAEKIARKNNLGYTLPPLLINQAKVLAEQKRYKLAHKKLDTGADMAREFKMKDWLTEAYKIRIHVDTLQRNFKSAFYNMQKYRAYSDSLTGLEMQNKTKELRIKYESEKKEYENKLLKIEDKNKTAEIERKNTIMIALAFVLIVFLILLIIIYRNRKKLKSKNIEIQNQNEEINTQAQVLQENLSEIENLTNFKEEMTHALIHDLKTPLNALSKLPEDLNKAERKEMRRISIHKMMNLITNILDIRKHEEVGLKPETKSFSVRAVWQDALKPLQYDIKSKNIKILSPSHTDARVLADPELTERIFTNLLTNAIKYSPKNGKIELELDKNENDFIEIKVSDQGTGISEKDIQKLFIAYAQAGKPIPYSTGIGLSFCKIAVEAQGGTISLSSKEAQGTTVSFSLPVEKMLTSEKSKNTETEIVLSEQEKKALADFLPDLRKLNIAEIGSFRKLFKQIEAKQEINQDWLSEIKTAVYSYNKERFEALIQAARIK